MSEKKIAIVGGTPICATEVDALMAKLYFDKRMQRQ